MKPWCSEPICVLHPRQIPSEYPACLAAVISSSTERLISVLGDWLRSKPVLVQINDSIFLHAGLHPDYLALGLSVAAVNEHYRQGLGLSKSLL